MDGTNSNRNKYLLIGLKKISVYKNPMSLGESGARFGSASLNIKITEILYLEKLVLGKVSLDSDYEYSQSEEISLTLNLQVGNQLAYTLGLMNLVNMDHFHWFSYL